MPTGHPSTRTRHLLLLACVALLTLIYACQRGEHSSGSDTSSSSLLHGLQPISFQDVSHPQRLTDHVAARDGDFWNSNLSSLLRNARAHVVYDLGRVTAIDSAYLQGDNNDVYHLAISDDNQTFRPLWDALPVPQPGLRTRVASGLNGSGRYLKLSASGGDGSYSVTELQVFETRPTPFPPEPTLRQAVRPDISTRSKTLLFALGVLVFLWATSQKAPGYWIFASALLPLALSWDLYRDIIATWPVDARQVALLRGTAAALAAAAVVREVWAPKGFLAHRAAIQVTLAAAALLALLSFANLGRPQFFNHKAGHATFIHPFDMRVYYPVAKYFNELRFDGVYLGSTAAFMEDQRNGNFDQVRQVEYRDLSTHRMVKAGEQREQVLAIKQRFTPERWQAFKQDMRYFTESMGPRDYLGSMKDHGGNATPVWIAIAHVLFANTTANDVSLGVGALLDPLLLALAFFAIFRTFGWRTSLACMVVFGANDFYMFGTNWAGATLRHDWMAYLALGICALKTERWKTAGALLAMSSLIRAFPATALVGAAVPAAYWAYQEWRNTGKLPGWSKLRGEQAPLLGVIVGAAILTLSSFAITSAMFGVQAWPEWLHKVHLLSRDPHVNHVSLKTLIAGSEFHQAATLAERMPLFAVSALGFASALFFLGRKRPLHQTATLGLTLIAVLFYPANYYIHFIFLLPMLATERSKGPGLTKTGGAIWLGLFGLCAAQYFTTLTPDLDLHFYLATVLLFAAFAVILVALWVEDSKESTPSARGAAEPGAAEPTAAEPAAAESGVADPGAAEPSSP
jgi:hypothetical protein